MKKLHAFTLIELLLTLVVSSIVMGLAYSGYEIIFKQFLDYKSISENIARTSQLGNVLRTDILRSKEMIKLSDTEIEMELTDKNIIYAFSANFVLRKNKSVQDTFFLPCESIRMLFLDSVQMQKNGLIDELTFSLKTKEKKEDSVEYHFRKPYGADILLLNTTTEQIPNP